MNRNLHFKRTKEIITDIIKDTPKSAEKMLKEATEELRQINIKIAELIERFKNGER